VKKRILQILSGIVALLVIAASMYIQMRGQSQSHKVTIKPATNVPDTASGQYLREFTRAYERKFYELTPSEKVLEQWTCQFEFQAAEAPNINDAIIIRKFKGRLEQGQTAVIIPRQIAAGQAVSAAERTASRHSEEILGKVAPRKKAALVRHTHPRHLPSGDLAAFFIHINLLNTEYNPPKL
jgi:hypothetical protein